MRYLVAALAALLVAACKDDPPPPVLDADYLAAAQPVIAGAARASPYLIDGEVVPHILCPESATQVASGTGVRVSPSVVVTALHVVENYACTVDGDFSITVMRDAATDFAVLRTLPKAIRAAISCAAPATDQLYFLSGYADSAMRHRTLPMLATGKTEDGMAVFIGFAVEGHSGGPVTGFDGLTYGIVLQRLRAIQIGETNEWAPRAGVLLFRDTPLCKPGRWQVK